MVLPNKSYSSRVGGWFFERRCVGGQRAIQEIQNKKLSESSCRIKASVISWCDSESDGLLHKSRIIEDTRWTSSWIGSVSEWADAAPKDPCSS